MSGYGIGLTVKNVKDMIKTNVFLLSSLFYLLAFLVGAFIVWRLFRSQDYEEEKAIDLVVWGTLVGILGGRLASVIISNFSVESVLHWGRRFPMEVDILEIFLLFRNGGFSLEAAVLTFSLFAIFFLRRQKWPFFPALDFLSLGAATARPMLVLRQFTSSVFLTFHSSVLTSFFFSLFLSLLVVLLMALIWRRFYSQGRLFALFLLSSLRPILALTAVTVFYMIEGRDITADFIQGFKEGVNMSQKTTEEKLTHEEKRLEDELKELEAADPKEWEARLTENEAGDESNEAETGSRVAALKAVIGRRLKDVQRAIGKLRRGSYGVCDRCGEKIDPARLKVLPGVSYCIQCEKRMEERS